ALGPGSPLACLQALLDPDAGDQPGPLGGDQDDNRTGEEPDEHPAHAGILATRSTDRPPPKAGEAGLRQRPRAAGQTRGTYPPPALNRRAARADTRSVITPTW